MSGSTITLSTFAVGVLVVGGVIVLVALSWNRRATKRTPLLFAALLLLALMLGGALTMVNLHGRASAQRAQAHAQAQVEDRLAQTEAVRHALMQARGTHLESQVEQHLALHSPPQAILDAGAEGGNAEDTTLRMTIDSSHEFSAEEADTGAMHGLGEPTVPLFPGKEVAGVSGIRDQRSCGWLGRFRPGSTASYLAHGGAFTALLILAYLFLDAGRRGRYTWPLRFGSAALFAGICLMLR